MSIFTICLGGGRIVGPQPLLVKNPTYTFLGGFMRYYHHHPTQPPLPPPLDWDNIQTFPQNFKGRAPLRERYKKLLCFSVLLVQSIKQHIFSAIFFCKSANLKCTYFAPGPFMMKVFLLVAHWNWASLFSLWCPSCLSLGKKRNISVVQCKAHKKEKKLTEIKSIFWLQYWARPEKLRTL